MNFLQNTLAIFYQISPLVIFYVAVVIIHYSSAHAYTRYCVPLGWYGFSISPFIISTPHCQAFRWAIHHFSRSIEIMWTVLGTWMATNTVRHIVNGEHGGSR